MKNVLSGLFIALAVLGLWSPPALAQTSSGCAPKTAQTYKAIESPQLRVKSVSFGNLFTLPSGISDWADYDFGTKGMIFTYTNSNPELVSVTQCGYSSSGYPKNRLEYEIKAMTSGSAVITVTCDYNGAQTVNTITVEITPAGDNPFTPLSNISIYGLGGPRNSADKDMSIILNDFFTLPDGWNVVNNWGDLGITYGAYVSNGDMVSDLYTDVVSTGNGYAYIKFKLHPVIGQCTLTAWIERNGVRKEASFDFEQYDVKCLDDEIYALFDNGGEINLTSNDKFISGAYSDLTIVRHPQFGNVELEVKSTSWSVQNIAKYTFTGPDSTPDWSTDSFRYRLAIYSDEAKTELVAADEAEVSVTLYSNFGPATVFEAVSAPGQFTNTSYYNFPALVGAYGQMSNVSLPSKSATVSLGSFGGYVVLGFDKPVYNNPQNPYGVDFSISGNAFKGNIKGMWTEPAAVMVMRDDNGNGLPDDTWYELAGSDYWWSTTKRNVTVTYQDPGNLADMKTTVPYTLSDGTRGAIYGNFPVRSVYALAPDRIFGDGTLTLDGTLLTNVYDMRCAGYIEAPRALAFGYTDNHVTQKDLHMPHNPYYKDENGDVADGFDISWAVDKDGNYVDLDHIDFIKIYNATGGMCGSVGESSAEIGAVAVTRPVPSLSETKDYYINYAHLTQDMVVVGQTCQFEGFAFRNGRPMRQAQASWKSMDTSVATIDNSGLLKGVAPGRVSLVFSATELAQPDTLSVDIVELSKIVIPDLVGKLYTGPMQVYVGETHRILPQTETTNQFMVNNQYENRFVYDSYDWECADSSIIDLAQDGFFVAKKAGTALVIITSKNNPELQASLEVQVNDLPVPLTPYKYLQYIENRYTSQTSLGNTVYKVKDLFSTANKRSVVRLTKILPEGNDDKFYWENDSLKNRLILGDYREYLLTFEVDFNGETTEITIPAFHFHTDSSVPVLNVTSKNIPVDALTLLGSLDLKEVFSVDGYAPEVYNYSFRLSDADGLAEGINAEIDENGILNVSLDNAELFDASPVVTVEASIDRISAKVIRCSEGEDDENENGEVGLDYEAKNTWHSIDLPIVKADYSGVNGITDANNLLRVFPNPAAYAFTINVSEATVVNVYSQGGALVGTYLLRPGEAIDVAGYAPGIYFVNLTDNGVTLKLVKE